MLLGGRRRAGDDRRAVSLASARAPPAIFWVFARSSAVDFPTPLASAPLGFLAVTPAARIALHFGFDLLEGHRGSLAYARELDA